MTYVRKLVAFSRSKFLIPRDKKNLSDARDNPKLDQDLRKSRFGSHMIERVSAESVPLRGPSEQRPLGRVRRTQLLSYYISARMQ